MKNSDARAEEAEFRDSFHADMVANPHCRELALEYARGLRVPGDPHVGVVALEIATKYLWVCFRNRSITALSVMTVEHVAALWAQGAHGAACYRARRRTPAQIPELSRKRRNAL